MDHQNTKYIYFPFEEPRKIGGPSTFMKNLKKWFAENHITVCENTNEAKAIFSPMFFDTEKAISLHEQGVKIILRLDGVYYPKRHGEAYKIKNDFFYKTYSIAEKVIFQSNYCKNQFFHALGELPEKRFTIIPNGADGSIFFPQNNMLSRNTLSIAMSGNFRHVEMLEPVIKALDILSNTYSILLHIIGPVTNNDIKKYIFRPYIKYHGVLDLKEIAEVLRNSHIYIYSFLNPPCPNSVIEAISCALPVVGFSSGALPELLFFSRELLADVSSDLFQDYNQMDYMELKRKIELTILQYDHYKLKARKHKDLFSFDECANKYIKVFNSIEFA